MPPPLFKPCVINSPFDGTLYNANMAEAENSFADLGPYVISGVTVTIGTGLSVNVASGSVSIGGRVTVSSTTIPGLTDNTTNHLYLLNTGGGTSNTTGTPPANSVKIGTAVTAGGVVTSVSMGRTSGRQQFVQPQNLVLGGPAAGPTSAGHPRAADLSKWNATQAEGFELFGTLPAGALPAAFTAPATFQVTDAGTTNEPTIMTWQHRTSGTPAASFGNTVLFRADNASNSLADQLSVATGWSTAAAGSESSLAIFSIRRAGANTEVLRLNSVGNGRLQVAQDFAHVNAAGAVGFFNATPVTQPVNTTDLRTAIINLGFLASGGATPLNLNGGALTAATITGDCLGAVTLTPGSVNRNLVRPTNDAYHALVLKENSATQSVPVFTIIGADNSARLSVDTVKKRLSMGPYANLVDAAAFPSGGLLEVTADQVGFAGASISMVPRTDPTAGGYFSGECAFGAYNPNNTPAVFETYSIGSEGYYPNGSGTVNESDFFVYCWTTNQYILGASSDSTVVFGDLDSTHILYPIAQVTSTNLAQAGVVFAGWDRHGSDLLNLGLFDTGATSLLFAVNNAGDVGFTRVTSTGVARDAMALTTTWVDSTDATRKARAVFNIWDTAAREALRLEASGTAPMIGVLGAAAAARTAAYTVTNPVTRRSFDTTTVTLAQLAQAVGTIIADQQLFGWFG